MIGEFLDKYKEGLFDKADFWLDTHIANDRE